MFRKRVTVFFIIITLLLSMYTAYGQQQEVEFEAVVRLSNNLPTTEPIRMSVEYPEGATYKAYYSDGVRHGYITPILIDNNCTITIEYTIRDSANKEVIVSKDFQITNITRELKILEIQPYDVFNFDKKDNYTALQQAGYQTSISKQPIKAFVSKIEPINGNYDIVYIGNVKKSGKGYSRFDGEVDESKLSIDIKNNVVEKYSGADITNKRAKEIIEYIESGQMFIMAENIFESSNSDTKIYKNFKKYYDNRDDYPNIHFFGSGGLENLDILTGYQEANKRPLFEITDTPKTYENQNGNIVFNDSLSLQYAFNVYNRNSQGPMKARLYVDVNGDGLYKDYEMVNSTDEIFNGEGYAINHLMDRVIGLQPWMLELEDINTKAKTKKVGYTAIKKDEVEINVLQIYPKDTNTSKLELDQIDSSKLHRRGEYKINVTKMSHSQFNNTRPDLNGVYDMIVLGFADAYASVDIDDNIALSKLKNYIATGQGVLFTHDILTYKVKNSSNWCVELTKTFRDMIGQNIYKQDAFNPEVNGTTGDDYITNSKKSVGYSREALDRAKYGGFDKTNETHKLNDGFLTLYPFILPQNLPVATTHYQYYQLDLEDEDVIPWFTLKGSGYNVNDGRNDYYTYTKGNITYSGTGHSAPNGVPEHEFFVNTMLKAVKGANHAPKGEIYGITNETFISTSENKLDFKIKADDIDLDDSMVYGYIYMDKNNNATYEEDEKVVIFDEDNPIEIGKFVDISLDLESLEDSIEDLRIKLVVYDDQGAEGFVTREIKRIDIPLLNVDTKARGCLINDMIDANFDITPNNMGTDVLFSDIVLDVEKEDSLNIDQSDDWIVSEDMITRTLDNINLKSTDTNMNTNTLTFNAEALSTGQHDLNYKLKYKVTTEHLNQQAFEQSGTLSVDVKSGKIYVDVKDKKGRGIESAKVTIDSDNKGNTGATGFFEETGISSGSYDVELTPPQGYILKPKEDGTDPALKRIHLSYDNPSEVVNYEVSGDCITDVRILDMNDQSDTKIVNNGRLLGKIRFRLLRKTKDLKINLSTDMVNYNIQVLSVKNITDDIDLTFNYASDVLEFDTEMLAKTYEANIIIDMNDTVTVGETRYISVDDAQVIEPHFVAGDSDDYPINVRLNLEVVEEPTIK